LPPTSRPRCSTRSASPANRRKLSGSPSRARPSKNSFERRLRQKRRRNSNLVDGALWARVERRPLFVSVPFGGALEPDRAGTSAWQCDSTASRTTASARSLLPEEEGDAFTHSRDGSFS